MDRPTTLGALRAAGWQPRTVKTELRDNLARKLRAGEEVFPGIVGYDRTVLPQVRNAILSCHDFILLGLRGQAKSRILRGLAELLDDALPIVAGSELREDPFTPMTDETRERIAAEGDRLPIEWIDRADRYHEKLATPDVTIADLIGDVDPIKAATQKRSLSDPGVIHYGLLPRSNRGILAINELPDLQARIQVGLLNILEEGDIQIRGFPLRLPLDVCLVFSANPEDYTNRGNIITPLRDRIASQVLTHYPHSVEESLCITRQEAWTERGEELLVEVPDFLELAIEEVAFEARDSEFVDQASGVSARMTIALAENVISSAEQRALIHGAPRAVARPSDLYAAISAISGKIELVYDGEREGLETISRLLVGKALKKVFDARLPDAYAPGDAGGEQGGGPYASILSWFGRGGRIDVEVDLGDGKLHERLIAVPGLAEVAARELCSGSAEDVARLVSAMEFVIEGLHQGSLLAKDELAGGRSYRDMLAEMADSLRS